MGFAVVGNDFPHTRRSINDISIMIYRNHKRVAEEWKRCRNYTNGPESDRMMCQPNHNKLHFIGAVQEPGEDPEWEGKYFGEFRIIIGFKFTDCRAPKFIIRSITDSPSLPVERFRSEESESPTMPLLPSSGICWALFGTQLN